MKWTILHLEASPGWGGQEIRILREAQGMRQRGHTVVFAVMRAGALAKEARKEGFVAYELNFHKQGWPVALPRLMSIIRRHRVSLVNTHSSLDSWIGGIAARFCKIPIVRTRHLSTPNKPGINCRLLYGTLADYVVTTCSAIVPSISEKSGKPFSQVRSIPTGVDLAKIEVSGEEARAFRRSIDVSDNEFLVGTACFMRSWKGLDDFIGAASLLQNEPSLRWVIIGGGHEAAYRKKAQELGLERVLRFTGHLENPIPALKALDVFALLSTAHEGVSQAILQAAALQKPLIATETGGLCEVCLDGQTGICVPCFSPERVAEAVLVLKNQENERTLKGKRARQLVLDRFLFQKTIDEMEEVYTQTTSKVGRQAGLKAADFSGSFDPTFDSFCGDNIDSGTMLLPVQNMLALKDQIFLTPAGLWIYRNRKVLVAVFAALMLVAGWWSFQIVRFWSHRTRPIEEIFEGWKKNPENEALFKDLQNALGQLSGPQPVRMQVAQSLLLLGRTDEAKAISGESLAKLRKISPEHAEFSEISFLISSQHFQEALERSVSLKESIKDTGSILYGKNLVRIALLQQKLGNRAGEAAAWNELQNFMGAKETAEGVLEGLGNRKIGFQAYLNERKKVL